jgi:hypothetical protein
VGESGNAEGYPIYWTMTSRYFIDGNVIYGNTGVTDNNWSGVNYDPGVYTVNGEKCSLDESNYYGDAVEHVKNSAGKSCVKIKMDSPAPTGDVTTHAADVAFEKVLAYGGASLNRDEVDARYMEEAKNGTATYKGSVTKKAGRIDKVSDVEGYTEANFPTGARPEGFDTDGDGMPDEWEQANGLNPNDKADGKTYTIDAEKKWYTNLEVYLNSLVEDIMKAENSDAQESVDEYYPAYKEPTGIRSTSAAPATIRTDFYNLQGQRIEQPCHGAYLITEYKADGTKQSRKVIK